MNAAELISKVTKLVDELGKITTYSKWIVICLLVVWGLINAWLNKRIRDEIHAAGRKAADDAKKDIETALHNMRVRMVKNQAELQGKLELFDEKLSRALETVRVTSINSLESYKKTIDAMKTIFERADKMREEDRKELKRVSILVDKYVSKYEGDDNGS